MRRSKRSDRYEANDQPYAGREDWQEAEYGPEDAYPTEDAYPPEDAYAPEEAYPPENAYAPEDAYPPEDAEGRVAYAHEDFWEDAPLPPEEPIEEITYAHSIFKPATGKPNFVLCVAVNVVRILAVLVLLAGLAALGAVAGIAKGYVETAPDLNLAALDEQAQTSFIYDAGGNLICEYKGTENRVMVSLAAMPTYLQRAFVAVEDSRFYTHNRRPQCA